MGRCPFEPLAPAIRRGLFLAPEFHRTDITKESGDKKNSLARFARSIYRGTLRVPLLNSGALRSPEPPRRERHAAPPSPSPAHVPALYCTHNVKLISRTEGLYC